MSSEARVLNQTYIAEMHAAPAASVLGRVRDLWWPGFTADVETLGAETTLDQLDLAMDMGREALFELAVAHATSKGGGDIDSERQRANQFLKSNTGKMFERFVGLALAHCLELADAPYAVMAFKNANFGYCHGISRSDFEVKFKFGDGTLRTSIDADIFAFNPIDPVADVYMISVKSTLKDRFHNVPFWNLLRRAAVSTDFAEVEASNHAHLSRMKYIAVCSDLAQEQPDFGTDAGARNLLQIDASLLDGAYVTASRARGLPTDCNNHLGDVREHAFYKYSCFYGHLLATS